jgi:hypothetical protein
MKKTILLTLLAALGIQVSAQQQSWHETMENMRDNRNRVPTKELFRQSIEKNRMLAPAMMQGAFHKTASNWNYPDSMFHFYFINGSFQPYVNADIQMNAQNGHITQVMYHIGGVPHQRFDFTTTPSGKISQINYYDYRNGNFELTGRAYFAYNVNQQPTLFKYVVYDQSGMIDWYMGDSLHQVFNAQGKATNLKYYNLQTGAGWNLELEISNISWKNDLPENMLVTDFYFNDQFRYSNFNWLNFSSLERLFMYEYYSATLNYFPFLGPLPEYFEWAWPQFVNGLVEENVGTHQSPVWVNDMRATETLSGGQVVETLIEYWGGNAWQPEEKGFFSYFPGGAIQQIYYQYHNGMIFQDDYRLNFGFDAAGNFNYFLEESPDGMGGWEVGFGNRWTMQYQSLGLVTERKLENNFGTGWEDYEKIIFTYAANIGIASINVPQVTLYPNPVSHSAKLELPDGRYELHIFSYAGQLLRQSEVQLSGGELLDLSYLNPGGYQLVIKGNNQVYSAKFIKQ